MLSDDELINLPDDPELAFVQFERDLRDRLHEKLEESEGYNSGSLKIEYINHVLAAAKVFELNILTDWDVPSTSVSDGIVHSRYEQFSSDVDHYTVQIRLRNARRTKRDSVALDSIIKRKIRHHLNKIKEIIDQLEVSDPKKEALYAKIGALENEVDRDRTRFEALTALILEAADTGGNAAKKLKPVREFINSITGLIKAAKDGEEAVAQRLPPPSERNRIEGPRKQLPAPDASSESPEVDDEIPF